MIKTIFYYKPTEEDTNQLNDLRGFKISGHALYAKHGEDIICAAVSALSLNATNALTELTSNHVDIQEDTGYLRVVSDQSLDEYGQLLLEALVLGIVNIQEEYSSEFIHIKFEEV